MRVLFFNPADYLGIGIPQGIALLSAILKQEGHEVDLFDTTFIKTKQPHIESRAGLMLHKKTPYTIYDLVKDDPIVDLVEEFQRKIDGFKPDLLAVSVMTTNYNLMIDLLSKVNINCPVIVGGVHPTLVPQEVISREEIDIICVGEGEEALPELCKAIENNEDYTQIKNLWVTQKEGIIHKNPLRPLFDLNKLPCPDWSLFDKRHLFRPFMGKMYTGGFYLSSRGCPGSCTYCVNRTLREMFVGKGNYFRFQEAEVTARHLIELKEKYGATWLKFGDDTFLLQPMENLRKLRDLIKPFGINFGCSVRPDTITDEKVKVVKEMGCVAMSIGVETGNERIRKEVLCRMISDTQMEESLTIINNHNIRISTFNLIGLPGETRENVFETIEFNRKMGVIAANVCVVYPFPGSQMFIQNKINNKDQGGNIFPMSEGSSFNLSNMSKKEVDGLKKTLNLYIILPKEMWPIIKLAEDDTDFSNELFHSLCEYANTLV